MSQTEDQNVECKWVKLQQEGNVRIQNSFTSQHFYMLQDLQKLGHDRELYYRSCGNAKNLHMTVTVLVRQFMKLHLFCVFLISGAHSEDILCWTKPHGTSHVLGTAVPSVVQQNSNDYQDVIQTTHSRQPVAEFQKDHCVSEAERRVLL